MQSSLFLVPNKQILKDTMSLNAEYLFQNDKFYDAEYDLGDKTIQAGFGDHLAIVQRIILMMIILIQ